MTFIGLGDRYTALYHAFCQTAGTLEIPLHITLESCKELPDTNQGLPRHWQQPYYPEGNAWPRRWIIKLSQKEISS